MDSGISMPSLAASKRESGIRPSPQGLSIGAVSPSLTTTRMPWRLAAIAAANPAGPPPITKTSVYGIVCSDIHGAAGESQRVGPEGCRVVHQVDHAARGGDKFIELFLSDYQRRRYFQDHEIVAADLSENAVIV